MLNAPYRIVGGVNFYSRREIKDILAYLKTVDNAQDDVAVRRIINVPKRGIGATTLSRLDDYAEAGGISFFEAACRASDVPKVSASAARKVEAFTDFIALRRAKAEDLTISGLIREILEATGYSAELKAEDTEDSEARLENLDELINKAVQYETQTEDPTLSGFLEEVALISDLDSVEDGDDRVLLMTLHAAKGLEFPAVYMTGMEEGLFPGSMSIHADDPDSEIEEERRLAYVGITRAKEQLTLTAADDPGRHGGEPAVPFRAGDPAGSGRYGRCAASFRARAPSVRRRLRSRDEEGADGERLFAEAFLRADIRALRLQRFRKTLSESLPVSGFPSGGKDRHRLQCGRYGPARQIRRGGRPGDPGRRPRLRGHGGF